MPIALFFIISKWAFIYMLVDSIMGDKLWEHETDRWFDLVLFIWYQNFETR